MAIKKIKNTFLSRQLHIASATIRAGLGWSGDQLRTIGLPEEMRESTRALLLQQNAESLVRELGELKGSIVKIGQILATYGDYCLPKPIATALHQFEAETEPVEWGLIQPYIEDALEDLYGELKIYHQAFAAASLSQVHLAIDKSNKRKLCLKILYPGIRETLDSDFSLIENGIGVWLGRAEKKRFLAWMNSIRNVLNEEVDFKLEAEKLKRWKENLSGDIRYVVPDVVEKYSGSIVLAMSYEDGVVQHASSVSSLTQDRRNNIARSMLELFLNEFMIWGEMQTDPHPGNYRIAVDANANDKIVLLDFGSVRNIDVNILNPLRKVLLSAYRNDRKGMERGLIESGVMDPDISGDAKEDFLDVIYGLTEPLNYKFRVSIDLNSVPSCAIDGNMMYCWRDSNLPKRMAKKAMHSAFSKNFYFPGADFLLLSRKLSGVYSFISSLDARFDASEIMEKVIEKINYPSTN